MAISAKLSRWFWRKSIQRKETEPPALTDVASDDLYFIPTNVNLDYVPTFGFERFLNKQHEAWAEWPLTPDRIIDHRIFGWLRRADALKLYEMAAMCKGDILELGTHQGLSSHIMAQALREFGDTGNRRIYTVDLDAPCIVKARENLAGEIAEGLVDARVGEAGEVCRNYIAQGKRFGFIFVDHSHYYGPMREVCQLLGQLVEPGGFVLFHDFTDPRSAFPEEGKPEPDFGVLAACEEALPAKEFEYFGAFGCAGLYRRTQAPPSWFVRLTRPLIPFAGVIALTYYCAHPILIFESALVNYLFWWLGCAALLVLGIIQVFRIQNIWSTVLGILLCLVSAPVWVLSSFLAPHIVNGKDTGYELVQEVELQNSLVRLYRTNGGATTAFGIHVRQEIPTTGLVFVRSVGHFYPCYSVQAARSGANSILIYDRQQECEKWPEKQTRESWTLALSRFVYF
ncbi:hypothetical protein F183_A02750 [Bryobacterales bacterium F-183]|nr:hypothetical protein F183_A02750 [Bryobacterales bacterium F-183]